MPVESRDSVSLKPAELDEFGQLLAGVGLPLKDEQLDEHVERFPLVTRSTADDELYGFLFGSLERIGGTPCILWGLGAIRRGRQARGTLDELVGELYRRAAISFPDEDVLVATRLIDASGYAAFNGLEDVVPRPGHKPTGEERAWARRLAKRFGAEGRVNDRTFQVQGNSEQPGILDYSDGAPDEATQAFFEGLGESDALIVFGWAMAEDLAPLASR
jgi:hypothetical protein